MKIEIVLMFKKNVTDSMISCEISWHAVALKFVKLLLLATGMC